MGNKEVREEETCEEVKGVSSVLVCNAVEHSSESFKLEC